MPLPSGPVVVVIGTVVVTVVFGPVGVLVVGPGVVSGGVVVPVTAVVVSGGVVLSTVVVVISFRKRQT